MKKILLILLLFSLNLNAQNYESINRKEQELIFKNKIREKATFDYLKNGDSIQKALDIYDENGNKIRHFYFKSKPQVNSIIEFKFNKNKLLEQVTKYADSTKKNKQDYVYEYNSDHNCILYETERYRGPSFKITQKYNQQNLLSEAYEFNLEKKKFELKSKYFYNESKKLLDSVQHFDKYGNYTNTFKCFYENNNLTKTYSTHKSKISTDTLIYTYDTLNRRISMQFTLKGYNKGVVVEKTDKQYIYKYDSDDNLISETYNKDGKFEKIQKYFYKKL